MKRILACITVLLLALSLPAYAEGVTMYTLTYDRSMVEGWYESAYPFPETLLYLNQKEDQVLVMLLDKEEYSSAEAYITDSIERAKEYAQVSVLFSHEDWQDPFGGTGKAASYSMKEGEGDDAYLAKTYLYTMDYDDYLLTVEMSFSEARDEAWIEQFTKTFFNERFSIQKEQADEQKTGYVSAMGMSADGSVVMTIDYVKFVWGEDEYDFTVEDDGEPPIQVVIDADAHVYIPNTENFESVLVVDPTAIIAAFNACHAQNSELLFEVVLKDGVVIWMDYCSMV